MEYKSNKRTKWCMYRKVTTFKTVYAGLILLYVPVLCDKDISRPLTYDYIYNSTNYAQLQNVKQNPNPYNLNNNNHTETKGTEEFKFSDKYEISKPDDLLVGFAHDPFRQSIPVADYMKGVRTMDPSKMSKDRGKRGVFHLYNMLACATGCDPVSYKGYGCYCGFLGSGRPTDGIDNCCRLHDECYENIYCPGNTVYFQPYYWKCFNGEPYCALENYQRRNRVSNSCSGRLCECDRRFAMCVRRYRCPRGRTFCTSDPLRLIQNILMFK